MARTALRRCAAAAVLAGGMAAGPAQAETRAYVVSWFAQATNSVEGDCSGGVHPEIEKIYMRYVERLGLPAKDVERYKHELATLNGGAELSNVIVNRGRINGEPVNGWTHPAAVPDLNMPGLDGKYAYGFNLDGKAEKNSFEDPETKEKGVDHALYRAMGCARAMRGTFDAPPTYWAWVWGQLRDSQPAWIITLTGDDLGKDGPITMKFERAIEYVRANPDGSSRANMSYRIDPEPRSHNTFKGEIKDGVVTLTEHGLLRLMQNPLVNPELRLKNFHVRLKMKPDRSMEGIIGGYQAWHSIYQGLAGLATGGEQSVTGDIPTFYHLMKRYADADPDPKTGQNMSISSVYYLQALPAYAQPPRPAEQRVSQK